MRDYLLDIIKHTLPLNAFSQLKVQTQDGVSKITATEGERAVVLMAKTHTAIPEFADTFGIPNLNLMNTLLNIPEYDDTASITVQTKDDGENKIPFNIHFKNAAGDFKNDFRLMSRKIIESLEPELSMNVRQWPVKFVPGSGAVQRLKYQSTAHPEERVVEFTVKDGKILASVGDASSHSGNFVFHDGIDENANYTIVVPIHYVMGILNMVGDKTMQAGDLGLMISVDSGLVNYDYVIPMVTK